MNTSLKLVVPFLLLITLTGAVADEPEPLAVEQSWEHPITHQGYLNSPLVEVTPLSFKGEFYLLENWRSQWKWTDAPDPSVEQRAEVWMARLSEGPENYDQREYLGRVLLDCTLGTALVWDDRVYVYAASAPSSGGGTEVFMTYSDDMTTWSDPVKVFDSPAGRIFNVAVTRDEQGMVFLWETDQRGRPFTMCMGRVEGPEDPWNPGIIDDAYYGRDKYTGGPALYYENGWYYLLYLESLPGRGWETRIARSRDLKEWIDTPTNRPFAPFNGKKHSLPLRPPEAVENNASDAEVCFHEGRSLIYYTGSDQQYAGDLQWATYDGPLAELFESFFDESNPASSPFSIERSWITEGYDGEMCWVHARGGAIPVAEDDEPNVVVTMQKLLLSGSDVFYAIHSLETDDGGKTWTEPIEQITLDRSTNPDGTVTGVCDVTPAWHAATETLLATGHTVMYQNNRVMHVRQRATPYSVYDQASQSWSPYKLLEMPDLPHFKNAGAGCTQRYDLPNGDVLLPIYFKEPEQPRTSVAVVRCQFDGETLEYVEHGNEMTCSAVRGMGEPSLTQFGDRFFLTIRNDETGYVAASDDGLHFDDPIPWTFDDGSPLGSYNTQQHWASHESGLYLVYTRRGAVNDHVFRHRAPLFIAKVDPERLCVIRETERVLVPERGARLGNFGVAQVGPDEIWVIATEWMQPAGCEEHGSNNRVWLVKLKF